MSDHPSCGIGNVPTGRCGRSDQAYLTRTRSPAQNLPTSPTKNLAARVPLEDPIYETLPSPKSKTKKQVARATIKQDPIYDTKQAGSGLSSAFSNSEVSSYSEHSMESAMESRSFSRSMPSHDISQNQDEAFIGLSVDPLFASIAKVFSCGPSAEKERESSESKSKSDSSKLNFDSRDSVASVIVVQSQ